MFCELPLSQTFGVGCTNAFNSNTEAHPFRRPDAQDRTKGPNRGPKAGVGSPAMQETHGIVEESHIRVAGEPGSAPKKPARKPAAAPKRLPPRS